MYPGRRPLRRFSADCLALFPSLASTADYDAEEKELPSVARIIVSFLQRVWYDLWDGRDDRVVRDKWTRVVCRHLHVSSPAATTRDNRCPILYPKLKLGGDSAQTNLEGTAP